MANFRLHREKYENIFSVTQLRPSCPPLPLLFSLVVFKPGQYDIIQGYKLEIKHVIVLICRWHDST